MCNRRRMTVPSRTLVAILLGSLALSVGCSRGGEGSAPGSAVAANEKAAQTAATAWLALVDAGKYDASWDESAKMFRGAVDKATWQKQVGAVRGPLGALASRKLSSAKYAKTLPGAPDGEYVVLQFEASFANKKSAVETVTPMLDPDGAWRVSGYYIK